MPEINRFLGIVIAMYYNDHDPPHFHVRYGSQRARFAIEDLRMMEGDITPRVRGLVVEWASRHHAELHQEWQLARAAEPLFPIAPLE
jgi:uncharacterized protein DUF4160